MHVRHWVAVLLFSAFITATSAFAVPPGRIPLERILQSVAGRDILARESGLKIVERIVGPGVPASERHRVLIEALRQPEMSEVASQLEERMNRIYQRTHDFIAEQNYGGNHLQRLEHVFSESRLARGVEYTDMNYWISRELRVFDETFLNSLPLAPAAGSTRSYQAIREAFVQSAAGAAARSTAPKDILERWIAKGRNKEFTSVYQAYNTLKAARPEVEQVLPEAQVYALLADEEMSVYRKRIEDVLSRMQTVPQERAFEEMLHNKVPAAQIAERIAGLSAGTPDAFRRALGEMTIEEVRLLVHGGNPLQPTPESLLGQYIRETGAATITRRFPMGPESGPGATTDLGPEKLVIAVSNATLPVYHRLFASENFLFHLHTPNQETLHLAFQGMYGSYGKMVEPLTGLSEGSLLPMILLKTSEGQRAAQFFELAASIDAHVAKMPWKIPGYLTNRGGYESCTHWVGNIPIGDKVVRQYKFPGKFDNEGVSDLPIDPHPRVADLQDFDHHNPLVKRVWKNPGQEQLSSVLGIGRYNGYAMLANPGWVAHVFTGVTSVDRVPAVFFAVADHTAAIPAGFPLKIKAK